MQFNISGSICEQETHLPIPGLIVLPCDPYNRFKYLLTPVVTDADGRFCLVYDKKVASPLFKARPTLTLRIYAPPWRSLQDSKPISWGSKTGAGIKLEIPKEQLGPLSPAYPAGTVEVRLQLAANALTIEKQGEFDVPNLPGFKSGGTVGGPSLPEQVQFIALPRAARNIKLDVVPGKAKCLPAARPLPVQLQIEEPVPDGPTWRKPSVARLEPRFLDGAQLSPKNLVVLGGSTSCHFARRVKIRVRPVQYDPLKQEYVYYPDLRYRVRYEVPKERATQSVRRIGQRQLEQMQATFERDPTYLARDIGDGFVTGEVVVGGTIPPISPTMHDIQCVILTSNYAWPDSKTDSPDPLPQVPGVGPIRPPRADEYERKLDCDASGLGPVDNFERLAHWKTQRGTPTIVVTVEQILNQTFGDCTDNGTARDLQEVLRNFIKKAYADWQFQYLLIGGNTQIVPMRYLIGYVALEGEYPAWDFCAYTATTEAPANTPPPRCFAVVGSTTKKVRMCHDSCLGRPTSNAFLCTSKGKAIPFKSTHGDGKLGWYFAKQNFTYAGAEPVWYANKKYEGFLYPGEGVEVCNLVVEGPAADIVDVHYYWAMYPERFIPSDLYYACLEENDYMMLLNDDGFIVDSHDLDLNGNQLYGQFRWNGTEVVTVDSWQPNQPDVYVGRAPIETGEEALGFVDKVLTYEQLRNPSGEDVDPAYLKRIVLAADVMLGGDHIHHQEPNWSDDATPDPGTFIHQPTGPSLLVHLQSAVSDLLGDANHALRYILVRFADRDLGQNIRLVRRTSDAIPNNPHWFFCKKNSAGTYVFSSEQTDFITIAGDAFAIKPCRIEWLFGPVEDDSATTFCEDMLDEHLTPLFSDFTDIEKYYVEYRSVSPYVKLLTPLSIRAQLDLGCHFFVPRGHGNYNGLSMVWNCGPKGARPDFKNRDRYMIAYADSCLTSQPDYPDYTKRGAERSRSLGETMVAQPNGGAVGYVGYTRIGTGGGDTQEKIFWHILKKTGRMGPAAAAVSYDGIELNDMYHFYNQVLYGDPEMPVWNHVPNTYNVVYPGYIDRSQASLRISVLSMNVPLKDQRVTLMGGWKNAWLQPDFLETRVTDEKGAVTFALDDLPDNLSKLTLTVTRDDLSKASHYKPFFVDIPVCESQSGWRRCVNCGALFFRYSSTASAHDQDCPAGGRHVEAAGEAYRIIRNSLNAPGQHGWRWCKKCCILFLSDAGNDPDNTAKEKAGMCFDGLPHDGTTSSHYVIPSYVMSAPDISRWSYCKNCHSVHCVPAGEAARPCLASGEHAIWTNTIFVIPRA